MFPKIETTTLLKKEKIAANIIHEDHIKDMMSKTRNASYKPWKSVYCPRNAHSPFGDFPKSFLNPKVAEKKQLPIYERALASSGFGFSDDLGSNRFGSGRGASVQQNSRYKHVPPPPYCGAKQKRKIPPTQFRK